MPTTDEARPDRSPALGSGDAVREADLFAASKSSEGRPMLRWVGHGGIVLPEGTCIDSLAYFINRIVNEQRPRTALSAADPAPDVGALQARIAELAEALTRANRACDSIAKQRDAAEAALSSRSAREIGAEGPEPRQSGSAVEGEA